MTQKRLILCCDGTWNDLRMRALTNVARLAQCLKSIDDRDSDHPVHQVVYYDDGVGADAEGVSRFIEGGIGRGLDHLVYEAYRFLCLNYQPGDGLYLFGFSRGAYTARSVAGLIGKVGLVPREHLKTIPEAMALYRQRTVKPGELELFRRRSQAKVVPVTFLGCWDTVGALGIPNKSDLISLDRVSKARYQFHDTRLGPHIERAAHAVAIDERRREFAPTLMQPAPDSAAGCVRECWFPGDHSCVGGGTWEKRGLANAALRWMVATAEDMGAPLAVDWHRLEDGGHSDATVFFRPTEGWLYSTRARSLQHVPWSALHASVIERWRTEPSYRPRNLKAVHGKSLAQLAPRDAPAPEWRWLRVPASSPGHHSGVAVVKGRRYRIRVSPLQVWQGGALDPCDVRGWNLIARGANARWPWRDGEQLTPMTITPPPSGRLRVPRANRMSLVIGIDSPATPLRSRREPVFKGLKFSEQAPTALTDAEPQLSAEFTAWATGELLLAANDVFQPNADRADYRDNRGWLWLMVGATVDSWTGSAKR